MMVLSLFFTLGWLYVIADYIKAHTNLANMSGTDRFFAEIIAVFLRWVRLGRRTGRAA